MTPINHYIVLLEISAKNVLLPKRVDRVEKIARFMKKELKKQLRSISLLRYNL